jgi:hypothetical protein
VLAAFVCASYAADRQGPTSGVLREVVRSYRSSPRYRLAGVRIPEIRVVDEPFSNALAKFNLLVRSQDTNAPSVRVACEPLNLVLPDVQPALADAIRRGAERFRANDAAWRTAISSNLARRVTYERRDVPALQVLQACCAAAELSFADDGRDIVIGNVYNLSWPPAIECRVLRLDERFFAETPDSVADLVAPRAFYDGPRDWVIPVPAANAVVVFHHPSQFGAIEASVERANRDVSVLIERIKARQGLPRGRTL